MLPGKGEISHLNDELLLKLYHELSRERDIMHMVLEEGLEDDTLADLVRIGKMEFKTWVPWEKQENRLSPVKFMEKIGTNYLLQVEQCVGHMYDELERRGVLKKAMWRFSERELTATERELLLGSDTPHELLKSSLQFLNNDLTTKVRYVPAQRDAAEWEAPIWGTIKREAIIDLNRPNITAGEATLLYLFRTSESWEKFDEAYRARLGQHEFLTNMQKGKYGHKSKRTS